MAAAARLRFAVAVAAALSASGSAAAAAVCVHGQAGAADPSRCVCRHGWGGPRCASDLLAGSACAPHREDALFSCGAVLRGLFAADEACVQQCVGLHKALGVAAPVVRPVEEGSLRYGDKGADRPASTECLTPCDGGECAHGACWCPGGVPGFSCTAPGAPTARAFSLEVLEPPADLVVPYFQDFSAQYKGEYSAAERFLRRVVTDDTVMRRQEKGRPGGVYLLPWLPCSMFGNLGHTTDGYLDALLNFAAGRAAGDPEATVVLINSQDRAFCKTEPRRVLNDFAGNASNPTVVTVTLTGHVITERAETCINPTRGVILPSYSVMYARRGLHTVPPGHNLPGRSQKYLLYFQGRIEDGPNDPCHKGNDTLWLDCMGTYAQGVRQYVYHTYAGDPAMYLRATKLKGERHPLEKPEDRWARANSTFCLVAGGEGFDTRLVDSILAGCVPVVTTERTLLPFHNVLPWERMVVHVQREWLPRLKQVLEAYRADEVLRMQQELHRHRDAFVWDEHLGGLAYEHAVVSLARIHGKRPPEAVLAKVRRRRHAAPQQRGSSSHAST